MSCPHGMAAVRAAMASAEPVELPPQLADKPAKRARSKLELAMRRDLTAELIGAIQGAHPDDARLVATAALLDLTASAPPGSPYGSVGEDARWWTHGRTGLEALPVLDREAPYLADAQRFHTLRKRLLIALLDALTPTERAAFLEYAGARPCT